MPSLLPPTPSPQRAAYCTPRAGRPTDLLYAFPSIPFGFNAAFHSIGPPVLYSTTHMQRLGAKNILLHGSLTLKSDKTLVARIHRALESRTVQSYPLLPSLDIPFLRKWEAQVEMVRGDIRSRDAADHDGVNEIVHGEMVRLANWFLSYERFHRSTTAAPVYVRSDTEPDLSVMAERTGILTWTNGGADTGFERLVATVGNSAFTLVAGKGGVVTKPYAQSEELRDVIAEILVTMKKHYLQFLVVTSYSATVVFELIDRHLNMSPVIRPGGTLSKIRSEGNLFTILVGLGLIDTQREIKAENERSAQAEWRLNFDGYPRHSPPRSEPQPLGPAPPFTRKRGHRPPLQALTEPILRVSERGPRDPVYPRSLTRQRFDINDTRSPAIEPTTANGTHAPTATHPRNQNATDIQRAHPYPPPNRLLPASVSDRPRARQPTRTAPPPSTPMSPTTPTRLPHELNNPFDVSSPAAIPRHHAHSRTTSAPVFFGQGNDPAPPSWLHTAFASPLEPADPSLDLEPTFGSLSLSLTSLLGPSEAGGEASELMHCATSLVLHSSATNASSPDGVHLHLTLDRLIHQGRRWRIFGATLPPTGVWSTDPPTVPAPQALAVVVKLFSPHLPPPGMCANAAAWEEDDIADEADRARQRVVPGRGRYIGLFKSEGEPRVYAMLVEDVGDAYRRY